MALQTIRFNDGEAYERGMAGWSQLAGRIFLDWLSPASDLRWIDIGCGNGAFTELIVRHCAPSGVRGIDPSEGQLSYARKRSGAQGVEFLLGDAMALPFGREEFDVAVMALAIFFVPIPAQGVAEMKRVVRPGGMIATYAWDMLGGGFPFYPIQVELRALGVTPPLPPSAGASRSSALRDLWTDAGLEAIETREIVVRREFASFDDFWVSSTGGESIRPTLAAMTEGDVGQLKARVRARLPVDADGRTVYGARANAITGRVPV